MRNPFCFAKGYLKLVFGSEIFQLRQKRPFLKGRFRVIYADFRIGQSVARLANHCEAAKIGRKGGLKGGRARVDNVTPEQRSESARKAVQARWAKQKQQAV